MPDPFTHYVFAFLLGKRLNLKEAQMRVFLVLTFVPDLDAASIALGLGAFQGFHGTVTHSIIGSLLLGAITLAVLGFVLQTRIRQMLRSLQGVPYFALPVLLHLGLDFFKTGFGVRGIAYFWPLDESIYSTYTVLGPQFALASYAGMLALAVGAAVYLTLRKEYLWGPWMDLFRKRP